MTLTPEQIKDLKQQLKQQVHNLPEDKKSEAFEQIDSLTPQALELMLKQQGGQQGRTKEIFRAIVDKEIPAVIIDENKEALAALDINPISKGHTIIISKKAASDAKELPTKAFALAKKLSKKISSKLKPSSVEIQTEKKFGEVIINLIPCYDIPLNINSPRQKSSSEELEKIAPLLRTRKKAAIPKIKKEAREKIQVLKLPRKIP